MSSTTPLENVLARLPGHRQHGNQWKARCPAHDDRQASLSVGVGDGGKVLLRCFANCEFGEIVAALGLTPAELMPPTLSGKNGHQAGGLGEIVATYDYRDEAGELLFQAVRFEPKNFRQRQPGSAPGKWEWNVRGVRQVVYRLAEVRAAIERGETIYVPEGEKDADNLWRLGLPATCNAMGAGKWAKSHTECLRGAARVIVLPDNDHAGREHAGEVAALLGRSGVEARVLELPGLRLKGDVSDWIQAGGSREALETLAEAAPPPPEPQPPTGDDDGETFHLTDLGNAERLVKRHSAEIRYCHAWAKWLVWDGKRWKVDDQGLISQRAAETVRSILTESVASEDAQERRRLAAWAFESEGRARLSAMVNLARDLPGVAIAPGDLDANPWLLNAQNGTIDLRSGELGPHRRGDFITKISPAAYDPSAEALVFTAFLTRILPDSEIRSYVQRGFGYSATGTIGEECLFMPYGSGRNGKSKLLGAVEYALGDYAKATGPETLNSKKGESIPNDVAALVGARLVITSEAEEGKRLDVARIKQLTGGDTMSARFMRSEFFEFVFSGKVWYGTNHKPVIRDTTNSIWARVKLIPFTVTIPEEEQDKELAEKLRAEAAGVLLWIVNGCLLWQEGGLAEPELVREAVSDYREEMDTLGGFLVECCQVEAGLSIGASELYRAYEAWCGRTNEFKLTQTGFGRRLGDRGFPSRRTGGVCFREGLDLRPEEAPEPPPEHSRADLWGASGQ